MLNHPAFTTGNFDTKFVDNYFHPTDVKTDELKLAALIAAKLAKEKRATFTVTDNDTNPSESKWRQNRMK